MMPDAKELARLQADMETVLMPDTCNILSVTYTADGQGGHTQAWGTATYGIACRIDPVKATELLAGGKVDAYNGYVVTLPHDTTVTSANRVEIDDVSYNILSVDTGKSWSACVRLQVEKA